MDWGITFLDELQRMKKKMDQTWSELFEENPGYGREVSQCIERLPKFEGTRRTSKSQMNKAITTGMRRNQCQATRFHCQRWKKKVSLEFLLPQ